MAITLVNGNRASGSVAAAGFDEAMTMAAGGSIALGNFLVLIAAYDNSGTAGVDPNMFIATSAAVTATPGRDLRGNYWWRVAKGVRNAAGVANDGAVVDIWICRVNNAYTNGDSITAQFSFSQAAFVWRIVEISGTRPITYSVVSPGTLTGSSATISAGAVAATSGQLVIGAAAVETNVAITPDSDTTNGSWTLLNNAGYNSGSDLTSMTLVAQSKITTGAGVQNWGVTKVGASDYAATAVVFDTYTPTTDSWISGNTHYSCPAGPEILPVGNAKGLIDVGTEYLFTHDQWTDLVGSQAMAVQTGLGLDPSLPSTSIQQHIIAGDLYEEGDEETYDSIESIVLYVAAAASAGAGAVVVGGGTVADAIASVGGSYIEFDTTLVNPYIWVTFDPSTLTSLFPDFRVMRWGVRYLAWKDDSSPAAPGEGLKFEILDSRANGNTTGIFTAAGVAAQSPGAFLVNNYRNQVGYELRWFGETNMLPRGKGIVTTFNGNAGASWTVQDLEHMANADQTVGVRITALAGEDPLQTNVFLDYIEVIVELVPERRLGTSMRKVSSQTPSLYPAGGNAAQLFSPADSTNYMTLTSGTKVLAIREALPASPSDYYAALSATSGARQVGDMEAVGPSVLLNGMDTAYDTLADQPNLRRALLSGGIVASPPQEMDTMHLAAVPIDLMSYQLIGSPYPNYQYFDPGNLGHVDSSVTLLEYIHVPGGQQYDRIKVLCRYDELTTGDLTISVQQPLATPIATATITKADVDAAPHYGYDTWAEVSIALSVPITPSAGHVVVVFSATTAVGKPWIVASALADQTYYSYDPGDTADGGQEWDYAVVLQCPLANPTYTFDNFEVATPPSGFGANHCAPVSYTVPLVTLTNADLYDWVTIQRVIGSETFDVALIQDPADDYEFIDYGCPWDITTGELYYVITGYRASDHRIVSTTTTGLVDTPTAPGALFGLATDSGLWLYSPIDSGDLEIQYNPLNPISKVQLHGYDYQVALRSPEERGLSVSVPIVVDSLSCTQRVFLNDALYPETASKGQQAMSPALFDPIRFLEKEPRLQLILPGGHHRWVMLDAGSLTVRTPTGTYIAEIELTDALAPSLDPWV